MKLTKFEHACLVLEKDGTTLVVDPGSFSHDFIMPKHVDGVVITHEHSDHLDQKLIEKILAANPQATVIAHESITSRFANHSTMPSKAGDTQTIGTITLQFFGGEHAPIMHDIQVPANLAVLFDGHLYYPGDSFTIPEGVQVTELALPVSGPWLKVSEVVDFLNAIKPKFVFPTHDRLLSEDGKTVTDRMVGGVANSLGIVYERLDSSSADL